MTLLMRPEPFTQEFDRFARRVFGTTNGGVTVRLPADTKADLRGQTVNGGINVEDLKVEEVERSRRSLEAKMNGGGVRVEAETTNGGITFTRG